MPNYEDLLRDLYKGCGREGDLVQLLVLMRQLSKEYFAGDATDQDVQSVLAQVCKTLVAHMIACNKQYTVDQCQKDLYNALLMSPPDNVYNALRARLAKRRKSNIPSGAGIL